ncbi:hypothetical protein BbuZS7_0584 [Borreliella burgdorferi ZS7]|uniref:Uncharacterized protein n=1 Tax=Borreliella burgdorferi (strain ZS7) TaxID=445985 RepID=A0A0H3C2Y4_BORBZ|nr:hypothetical protein BbuZS7_0584 [Borreliella burgdorferi ZS7]
MYCFKLILMKSLAEIAILLKVKNLKNINPNKELECLK